MTIEEVTDLLLEDGWKKQFDRSTIAGNETPYLLYRQTQRQDLPQCVCNEKPVQLVLKPVRMNGFGGFRLNAWTVELRAAIASDRWVSFNEYGIQNEHLLERLHDSIGRLEAAWKAAA